MSTRATYCFLQPKGSHCPTITYYIHHDGYPNGAAVYFKRMLLAAERKQVGPRQFAEQFLIANREVAEFTTHHDAHGDTEYRYTYIVENGKLFVKHRTGNEWSKGEEYESIEAFVAKWPDLANDAEQNLWCANLGPPTITREAQAQLASEAESVGSGGSAAVPAGRAGGMLAGLPPALQAALSPMLAR